MTEMNHNHAGNTIILFLRRKIGLNKYNFGGNILIFLAGTDSIMARRQG